MDSNAGGEKDQGFLLNKDLVYLDINLKTPDDVFAFIGRKAQELGVTIDGEALSQELGKREESLSTGLMDGFAIPHAKTDLVSRPAVMFIRTCGDVNWKMFEGEAAKQFFAMLVPERCANEGHLQMLSKIAVCLLDEPFRNRVQSIESPEEMATYLKSELAATE